MKYFYACVLFFNFIFVTARITFSSYKCFNQNVSSLFQVLLTLNRWIMKINYLPNQEDQEDSLLTISVFALILPFNPRKRCSRNVWGCSSPLSWQGSARYETMAAVSGVSLWQQQDLLTPSLLHSFTLTWLSLCVRDKQSSSRASRAESRTAEVETLIFRPQPSPCPPETLNYRLELEGWNCTASMFSPRPRFNFGFVCSFRPVCLTWLRVHTAAPPGSADFCLPS